MRHLPTFRNLIICTAVVLLSFNGSVSAADDETPSWLKQAASGAVPSYEKDVPAVVLVNEQIVNLGSDGKLVTTENYAVKILNRDGRRYAVARAFYLVSTGKIKEMNGWTIRLDGTSKSYDKKTILDFISDDDDVYNEGRVKLINATDDVDTGFVFAYTVVSEETPLFYQDRWEFQGRLPVLLSRYSLSLPSGWTATSITFNSPEIKPQINGSSYSWQLNSLPPIPPEPMSPSVLNLSPRIVVNYGSDTRSASSVQTFKDWTEVSRWATAMHEPQVIVDDNIAAKARDLTANSKTELEKIRAIGTFVQNLQYISIDIGVGHGNGYRPRSSTTVLNRGYGDCKDKANLMRALLRSLKIEAYPIAIYSGDPTFVREQWPSPKQFNHCIIAVKVSDSTYAPTVITHAKLGRLLIFDATDQFTSVGDLPDYLQGSMALIAAGENGGLERMPITPPDTDLLERNIEASISSEGVLTGKITERALGQVSTSFRRETRELSAAQYRKAIEGWLTRGATGAQLVDLKYSDTAGDSRFDLAVDFNTPRYGQVMQGRLLIFKPVVVGRRRGVYLTEPKRSSPIEMDSSSLRETAIFTIPAGFGVDETPAAVDLESDFGKYSISFEVKGDKLTLKRSLVLRRMAIPANKYEAVRSFYSKMLEAEQAPVVLIKK